MKRLLLALTIWLCVAPAWATTYYVGKSGSNGNSCATAQSSTAGNRKLSIAGGAGCLSSGDTLIVGNGTYTEQLLNLLPTGTSNTTRTIMQAENRRQVIVQPGSGSYVLTISGNAKKWITIDGFVFDGTGISFNVVKFEGNDIVANPAYQFPQFIRFQNNTVRNFTTSIQSGLLVASWLNLAGGDNEILYNNFDNIGNGNSAGLYITNGRNIIDGNDFNNIHWTGVTINKQNAAFPDDNIVRNNRFHNSQGQGVIIAGGFRNRIHNNIFYANTATAAGGNAIHLLSGANANEIYNNSCYSLVGSCIGIVESAVTGTIVRNNQAFSVTGSVLSNSGTSTTSSNNSAADPSYINAAAGNLALSAGSAAIDAGFNVGQPFNGSAPDLGAYETILCSTAEVGLVAANRVRATCTNNVRPPLLPASGITGVTVTQNGTPVTVSSCARMGTNIIDCTLAASITGGTTVLWSYSTSTGNVTDSACIGDGSCATGNQRLNAVSNLAVTNNVAGGGAATLTQTRFRFHDLRGTEAAPVVKPYTGVPVSTPLDMVPGAKFRIRLKVACTVADCDPLGMALRYSKNSGAYTLVPDGPTFDADNIAFVGANPEDPDVPSSGTATTELLTSDHATNVACAVVRTANAVPNVNLVQNSETECEYAVAFDTDVSVGDTYDFRLYNQNGSALSAYTVTPRATVVPMAASGGR